MKTYKSFMIEGSKEEYQKFFDKKLKKYGVKSPEELSDEEKKKFFNEIDKEWQGDDEKKESLVKEYIKTDGARRRCSGGDGRRKENKKKVATEEEEEEIKKKVATEEEISENMKDEVYELKLYIENDGDLYRQRLIPIVKNIQNKMKSGKYEHNKAPKLWRYLVDDGAKKYQKEFPGVKFDKKVRDAVAEEFADEYKDEIEAQDGKMF